MNQFAGTPAERAQFVLDRCPVHPSQLGSEDPLRILHDWITDDASEAASVRDELKQAEIDVEATEDRLKEAQAEIKELERDHAKFVEQVRDALGEEAEGASDDDLPALIRALRHEGAGA